MKEGGQGETYCIGGNNEMTNIQVVSEICEILDEISPLKDNNSYSNFITFVEDRPGHDKRYAIDSSKLVNELGWSPKEDFKSGLRKTVEWYLSNQNWCSLVAGESFKHRLGLNENNL